MFKYRGALAVTAESKAFQLIVRRSRTENEYLEIQAQPSIQPTWFLVIFLATFLKKS